MSVPPSSAERVPMSGAMRAVTVVVWLWVLVPLAYGVYQLVLKIPALFG